MHDHDHDHDHHHDENVDDGTDEDNVLYKMENIKLVSVGIDIGSSGTQVIFSLLKLKRAAKDLSSRFVVVSRDSIYRSPVTLTPYIDSEKIDDQAIGKIVGDAYTEAGIKPDEVHTGAVILTGEAIRRHNARAIADVLAVEGGQFVCASAGHNMEALLAAYGSGASHESYERECRILNIDIGGGTTKLAIVEKGRVVETAAVHIGGRLIAYDENNRITRLEPGGAFIAEKAGIPLQLGDILEPEALGKITSWMAQAIVDIIQNEQSDSPLMELYLTAPLKNVGKIEGVLFSGGVGEYVYGREQRSFGDLGKMLGHALMLKGATGEIPWPLLPAKECIRATVVGASEFSVQVSGNTLYLSNESLIPKKNLQVLKPSYELKGPIDSISLARSIREHYEAFDLIEGESEVALAFQWVGEPSYVRVSAFAEGLVEALSQTIKNKKPIYVVLDGDLARTVGSILKEEFHVQNDLLTIDSITLQDFDYIDIGQLLQPSGTIPVTVKSLIFQL